MFGDITFAQAPFAALGGNSYNFAVSESSVADSSLDAITSRGGIYQDSVLANGVVSNYNNLLFATDSESASATASPTARADVLALIAELAQGTATSVSIKSVLASIAETANASASSIAGTLFLVYVNELAQALDAPDGARIFAVAISEEVSGADVVLSQRAVTGTVAEFAQASSTVDAIANITANVDGVQLYVSINNTLVWGTINNSQNVVWVKIPT